jgi:general secretion pathway protein J
MRPSGADTRNAGFTLMEVLVALVVLGMLFVGLTQGVRLGINAWNEESRIVAQRDQLDDADRALRELLSHMNPNGGAGTAAISGAADQLKFSTQLPTAVALATRNVNASLFVDAHHRLIFRWKLNFHEQSLRPPAEPTDTELLSGVAKINFHYWSSVSNGPQKQGWQESWDGPGPPGLVKLHVSFEAGDPRHWPDIIIAPALDHQNE